MKTTTHKLFGITIWKTIQEDEIVTAISGPIEKPERSLDDWVSLCLALSLLVLTVMGSIGILLSVLTNH